MGKTPEIEMVPIEVYKQVVWERDVAIAQLKELGYELGEKIEEDDILISRKAALSFPFANGKYDHEHANLDYILGCETYKEWLETLHAAGRKNRREKENEDE